MHLLIESGDQTQALSCKMHKIACRHGAGGGDALPHALIEIALPRVEISPVNGQGLGRREPALGICRLHFIEARGLEFAQARTRVSKPLSRGLEGLAHGRIEIIEKRACEDAEPQPGRPHRRRRRGLMAGHHLMGKGAIGDRCRQGAEESSV